MSRAYELVSELPLLNGDKEQVLALLKDLPDGYHLRGFMHLLLRQILKDRVSEEQLACYDDFERNYVKGTLTPVVVCDNTCILEVAWKALPANLEVRKPQSSRLI